MMPGEHSVTRSWLSWLVIRFQPWFSPPTRAAGRHADVLVERVVDVVVPQELHRDDADARRVHGHQEHGDALVLGDVRVGAGGQPDVVGVAGEAGEDLRAVDHVLVAVTHGSGGERGQVGTRVRLRVADAEVDLAGQDLGEEELLLLLRAEVHDRRPDRVDGEHGHRCTAAHRLVEEDELLNGRTALAAPFLGPADAEPAVAAHLLDDLAHDGPDAVRLREVLLELGRQEVLVVGAQLALERLLLLGQGNFHRSLPGGGALSAHVSALSSPARPCGLGAREHVTVRLARAANGAAEPFPTDK